MCIPESLLYHMFVKSNNNKLEHTSEQKEKKILLYNTSKDFIFSLTSFLIFNGFCVYFGPYS